MTNYFPSFLPCSKIDDVTVIVAVVVHLPTDAISGTPMVSSGILDPTSR